MPTKNSPIRWDKVKEGRKLIKDHDLENATTNQKLFFLFLKRIDITQGLSRNEISLIVHEDETETVTIKDEKTGQVSQVTRPTREAWQKQHQENKIFRMYCWEKGGVIFFCGTDPITGAQLYYNMTKTDFLKLVMQHLDKITKGARKTKNKILKWIKLPPALKKQLTKNAERQVHQEIMESMIKQMKKKRKKERKEIEKEIEASYVQ